MSEEAKKNVINSLRITEEDTLNLISLYKEEECLWNSKHIHYRSRSQRQLAAERIADNLNLPRFGPKHVVIKFKNLRNAYSQELKKIARAEADGESYTPTVFWYHLMDSFIRPHLQKPRGGQDKRKSSTNQKSNLVSFIEGAEESLEDEFNDDGATLKRTPTDITSDDDASRLQTRKRKSRTTSDGQTKISKIEMMRNNFDESITIKSEDFSNDASVFEERGYGSAEVNQIINSNTSDDTNRIVDAIQGLSTSLQRIIPQDNDIFDTFGKYVVGLLRSLPPRRAMELQPLIVSLITEAGVEELTKSQNSTEGNAMIKQ